MPSLAWQVRAQGGYSTRAAAELTVPPAGPCAAPGCDRTDTRRYGTGARCPAHTPAAVAGRPEPPTGDGPDTTPPAWFYTSADLGPMCETCAGRMPIALAGHMVTHPACEPWFHAHQARIRRQRGRR